MNEIENNVEMNEVENNEVVANVSNDKIVKGMIFLAGVATPFAIKGIVKLVKYVAQKIKDKKSDEDETEDFSDFDEVA